VWPPLNEEVYADSWSQDSLALLKPNWLFLKLLWRHYNSTPDRIRDRACLLEEMALMMCRLFGRSPDLRWSLLHNTTRSSSWCAGFYGSTSTMWPSAPYPLRRGWLKAALLEAAPLWRHRLPIACAAVVESLASRRSAGIGTLLPNSTYSRYSISNNEKFPSIDPLHFYVHQTSL
jgi:hypothetical protein